MVALALVKSRSGCPSMDGRVEISFFLFSSLSCFLPLVYCIGCSPVRSLARLIAQSITAGPSDGVVGSESRPRKNWSWAAPRSLARLVSGSEAGSRPTPSQSVSSNREGLQLQVIVPLKHVLVCVQQAWIPHPLLGPIEAGDLPMFLPPASSPSFMYIHIYL